jgi:hypothetical protein
MFFLLAYLEIREKKYVKGFDIHVFETIYLRTALNQSRSELMQGAGNVVLSTTLFDDGQTTERPHKAGSQLVRDVLGQGL